MAKPKTGAEFAPAQRKFGMRDLWRLAVWGLSAAAALTLVGLCRQRPRLGRDRLHVAVAEIHEILIPSGAKPIRPLDAREGRRLAETVRVLAADRERLLARVATLEQSLDGITGSIARVEKAAKTPGRMPLLPPAEPAPRQAPPEHDVTSSVSPPGERAAVKCRCRRNRPVPSVSKTEFGLDLGSASTVEALRTAWTAALRRHGPLLEGLRPVVQMRERPRPGGMELRLIAGPDPQRRGGGPALRRDDRGGRDLRARGVRRPAARRSLIASA